MAKMRGFTIVELLVAIVVMAMLAAMGLPEFQNFIAAQRIKSASFDLYSSLLYARNEASHRRVDVTVTPTGNNWANGWEVQLGAGSTTVVPLRIQPAMRRVTSSTAGVALTYSKDGRTGAAAETAIALESDRSGVEGRCIYIEPNGAPRTKIKTGSTCP